MKKKPNTLLRLLIITIVIFTSCSSYVIKKYHYTEIDYEIIKKDWFVFSSYKKDTVFSGHVLLNLRDTLITYYDITQNAYSICVKENMPYARFYLTKECHKQQNNVEQSTEYKILDCYVGLLDLRPRGLKWQYSFKKEDFVFNTKIPGVIDRNVIFRLK